MVRQSILEAVLCDIKVVVWQLDYLGCFGWIHVEVSLRI